MATDWASLFDTRVISGVKAVAGLPGLGKLEALVARVREELSGAGRGGETFALQASSFFEDGEGLAVLREVVLPDVVERRRGVRKLRIWCAGCSTGQEVYCLAMLLLDLPELDGWDVRVEGTEISREAVEYARRGRYRGDEVERGLSEERRTKYFRRDGEAWVVQEKLRSLCGFECADLTDSEGEDGSVDVVLLRHVMLYLPQEAQAGVLAKVWRRIRTDGYLVPGRGEQLEDAEGRFDGDWIGEGYIYRPITAGGEPGRRA